MSFSNLIASAVKGAAIASGDSCPNPKCIFAKSPGGGCMFETCLLAEFPPNSGSKLIKCIICEEEQTYTSGEMHKRICEKCEEKLLNAGKTRTECVFCGEGVVANEEQIFLSGICNKCMERISLSTKEGSMLCPTCGKVSVPSKGNMANLCDDCTKLFTEAINDPKCPMCGKTGVMRPKSFNNFCDDCMEKIRTIATITYVG